VQAVILAGGRGTRLEPLTQFVPKPMAPVARKPFLEHQLAYLRQQSITRIVLLVGYLWSQVEEYFGDGRKFGLSIRYSVEETPLGTGGALREAGPLLDDEFLLLNGDSFLPIDYHEPFELLRSLGTAGVMVVHDNGLEDAAVPNNVQVNGDGMVVRYFKTAHPGPELTHVDAGVLALRRSVLDLIPSGTGVSLESDVYPELIRTGQLAAYASHRRFYDIGSTEKLAAFEAYLMQQSGHV
jgi:NDP-sugar pyrophosphorylase family protein